MKRIEGDFVKFETLKKDDAGSGQSSGAPASYTPLDGRTKRSLFNRSKLAGGPGPEQTRREMGAKRKKADEATIQEQNEENEKVESLLLEASGKIQGVCEELEGILEPQRAMYETAVFEEIFGPYVAHIQAVREKAGGLQKKIRSLNTEFQIAVLERRTEILGEKNALLPELEALEPLLEKTREEIVLAGVTSVERKKTPEAPEAAPEVEPNILSVPDNAQKEAGKELAKKQAIEAAELDEEFEKNATFASDLVIELSEHYEHQSQNFPAKVFSSAYGVFFDEIATAKEDVEKLDASDEILSKEFPGASLERKTEIIAEKKNNGIKLQEFIIQIKDVKERMERVDADMQSRVEHRGEKEPVKNEKWKLRGEPTLVLIQSAPIKGNEKVVNVKQCRENAMGKPDPVGGRTYPVPYDDFLSKYVPFEDPKKKDIYTLVEADKEKAEVARLQGEVTALKEAIEKIHAEIGDLHNPLLTSAERKKYEERVAALNGLQETALSDYEKTQPDDATNSAKQTKALGRLTRVKDQLEEIKQEILPLLEERERENKEQERKSQEELARLRTEVSESRKSAEESVADIVKSLRDPLLTPDEAAAYERKMLDIHALLAKALAEPADPAIVTAQEQMQTLEALKEGNNKLEVLKTELNSLIERKEREKAEAEQGARVMFEQMKLEKARLEKEGIGRVFDINKKIVDSTLSENGQQSYRVRLEDLGQKRSTLSQELDLAASGAVDVPSYQKGVETLAEINAELRKLEEELDAYCALRDRVGEAFSQAATLLEEKEAAAFLSPSNPYESFRKSLENFQAEVGSLGGDNSQLNLNYIGADQSAKGVIAARKEEIRQRISDYIPKIAELVEEIKAVQPEPGPRVPSPEEARLLAAFNEVRRQYGAVESQAVAFANPLLKKLKTLEAQADDVWRVKVRQVQEGLAVFVRQHNQVVAEVKALLAEGITEDTHREKLFQLKIREEAVFRQMSLFESRVEELEQRMNQPAAPENIPLSFEAIKEIIVNIVGDQAKVIKLNMAAIPQGATFQATLDAGSWGKLSIEGSIVNTQNDIAVHNLNIDGKFPARKRLKSEFSSLVPKIRKHLEEKHGKVSSLQIVGSNLVVGLEKPAQPRNGPSTPEALEKIVEPAVLWELAYTLREIQKEYTRLAEEKGWDDTEKKAGEEEIIRLMRDELAREFPDLEPALQKAVLENIREKSKETL